MRARALLLVLILIVALPAASAQDPLDHVEEELRDIAAQGDGLVDALLDGVGDAVEGLGSVAQATGSGLLRAASYLGEFIATVALAVGQGIARAATGIASVGAIAALGLGTTVVWLAGSAGSVLAGTGQGIGAGLAVAGQGIAMALREVGVALAFVAARYADLVMGLRPDFMPPVAFAAVVGAGTASTATAGGWAGWQVLRRWGLAGTGLAGLAGFSRIQDDELLEHPVRSQIFDSIRQHPGIHASQLAREVGVGWGTVSHHLDKLERARIVAARKVNNQRCYFEQGGTVGRSDMQVASAVKGDTAGRIAAYVHHHPLSSQKALATALGISPALASFHTTKLVRLGVLEKIRHGKESLLTTSQAMRRLLESDRSVAAALAARGDEALQYSA